MRREELGWRSSTYVSTISNKRECVVPLEVQLVEHGCVMRLREVVSRVGGECSEETGSDRRASER